MPETKTSVPLAHSLTPAGPVANPAAAERLHETLAEASAADGWTATLEAAWPALAPSPAPPLSGWTDAAASGPSAPPAGDGPRRRPGSHPARHRRAGRRTRRRPRALAGAEGRPASADGPGRPGRGMGSGCGDGGPVVVRRCGVPRRPARRRRRTEGAGPTDLAARRSARPDPWPVRSGDGQTWRQRAELFLRHRHFAFSSRA